MAGWEGLGARLKQAMIEKGFVNRRGDADVTRFALSNGWIPNYIYRYLSDQSAPERPNLEKLGEVLGVSPAWLLFGDEVSKAPAHPRKRGARKVGCLVAALLGVTLGTSATTPAWGAPRAGDPMAPAGSVTYADNVRGITSRRRRRTTTDRWSHYLTPNRRYQSLRQLTCRAA